MPITTEQEAAAWLAAEGLEMRRGCHRGVWWVTFWRSGPHPVALGHSRDGFLAAFALAVARVECADHEAV